MAPVAERPSKSVYDEAVEWIIALGEHPDDVALRARFAAWHDAHASHAAAWRETSRSYQALGPALQARRARKHHSRRIVLGSAGVALAAGVAGIAGPGLLLSLQADYRTTAGETREITLADGSSVVLAPESSIAVTQGNDARGVKLLAGRAFFEVTSDPNRPFQVETGGIRVTVLGTAFDVKSGDAGPTVSVQHGRVQVNGATAQEIILNAGDWLKVDADGSHVTGTSQPDQFGAWKNGQLFVIDQPVSTVVEELRPYFKGAIVLADADLGQHRVTGIYNLHKPLDGLRAMSKAYAGVSVRQVSPWLIVISRL